MIFSEAHGPDFDLIICGTPGPKSADRFTDDPPINEDPVARRLELFDDAGQPLCRCRPGQCGGHESLGTATRPPGGDERWRVDHPGIGVLAYDTEAEARSAAGTAGTLIPPGGKS